MLFTLLITAIALAEPVPLVEGRRYYSGTTVLSRQYGATVTIPAGWNASAPDGSTLLLAPSLSSARVIVKFGLSLPATVFQEMLETPLVVDGIPMKPLDRPGAPNAGLTGRFSDERGRHIAKVVAKKGANGGAAVLFAVSRKPKQSQAEAVMEAVIETLDFSNDIVLMEGDGDNRLFSAMANQRLSHETAGRADDVLWLCGDGRKARWQASGAGDAPSDPSGWSGTWTFRSMRVLLIEDDGTVLPLAWGIGPDETWFLAGRKYQIEMYDCSVEH